QSLGWPGSRRRPAGPAERSSGARWRLRTFVLAVAGWGSRNGDMSGGRKGAIEGCSLAGALMTGLLRNRKESVVESGGIDAGRQQPAPSPLADALSLRAEVERRHVEARAPGFGQREAPGLRRHRGKQ